MNFLLTPFTHWRESLKNTLQISEFCCLHAKLKPWTKFSKVMRAQVLLIPDGGRTLLVYESAGYNNPQNIRKRGTDEITEITFVFLLLSKIHTPAAPLEGTRIDDPKFGNVKICRQL